MSASSASGRRGEYVTQGGGADIVQEPTDQPYGVRDAAVRDPSGNLIRINHLN